MNPPPLYPLRFDPIYQYRLWGGRRLGDLLTTPLPEEGTVGEAWILSDRADHSSRVSDGPLKGQTLGQLLEEYPELMLGNLAYPFRRFPLLLKFLDVRTRLSVQVHPSDQKTEFLPPGETGKTEAWVVLEAGTEGRIYAGLKPDAAADSLRVALTKGTVADYLSSFTPKPGDGVLIPAGTVHSLGDVVVFEVQENSDVTFRLYDWNHLDPQTGRNRPLQVDQALACIDFAQGIIGPIDPMVEEDGVVLRERLFFCEHFGLWRCRGESPFPVGAVGTPRILVCIAGEGCLEHAGADYVFSQGDVLLLPAVVGACQCRPNGPVNLLEISFPEGE